MKKIVVTIFVIALCVFSVFSSQKTYRTSDEVYKNLIILSNLSGAALPSMTTPITAAQINQALKSIDKSKLSGYGLEIYSSVYKEVTEPDITFGSSDAGLKLNLSLLPFEVWGNVTDSTVEDRWDWTVESKDRFKIYELDSELFISPYFFGRLVADGTQIEGQEQRFIDGKFRLASILKIDEMSQDWPEMAFGSLGNQYLSFIIGRDRLSAGRGNTGNLYLAENRRFDDFAKFSAYSKFLSYDFTAIMYDGYQNPKTTGTDFKLLNPSEPLILRNADFSAPRKMVFIHRFSSVLLNKITFSAYEGAVVYGGDSLADLRALNPFMFIHNNGTYYSGNTNNFAGIEIDSVLINGLSINAQVLVDQFKLSGESEESGKTQMGFLTGINGAWSTEKGIISAYCEGVYTTKGLYLKEEDNTNNGYRENGTTYYYAHTDLISGNKRYANSERDEVRYLGYQSDIFKIATGVSFKMKNREFAVNTSFSAKGCYGIGVGEQRILDAESKGETQYCFSVSASAKARFLDAIDCSATISSVNYRNYQHRKSENNNQLQLALGCRIYPMQLLSKLHKTL